MIPQILSSISKNIQAIIPGIDEFPPELVILTEVLCKNNTDRGHRRRQERKCGHIKTSLSCIPTLSEIAASKALRALVVNILATPHGEKACKDIFDIIKQRSAYGSLIACTGTSNAGKKCTYMTRVFFCSPKDRANFKCPMCKPKCKVNSLRRLQPGGYNICPVCRGFTLYTEPNIVNGEQSSEKTKCFVCAKEKHTGILRQMAAKLPVKTYIEFLYSINPCHHLLKSFTKGSSLSDVFNEDESRGIPPKFEAVTQRDYLIECLAHSFYEYVFSRENIRKTIFKYA